MDKKNPDPTDIGPLFEDGKKPFREVVDLTELENLKTQVAGSYNPEILKYGKMDRLGDHGTPGDDMTDLEDMEIIAMALYRSVNDTIIALPSTMAFLDHVHSLRRSRRRMGRQEWLEILKGHPPLSPYNTPPYSWEGDERAKGPGLIGRIKKLFGGGE